MELSGTLPVIGVVWLAKVTVWCLAAHNRRRKPKICDDRFWRGHFQHHVVNVCIR